MRIRHVLAISLLIVLVVIGVFAVTLYDPLAAGRRVLEPSQLITAPTGKAPARTTTFEKPIEQTDPPAVAALARRYQPTLVVSAFDRLWPTSLLALMASRWHGHHACIYVNNQCAVSNPSPSALAGDGSASDYLRFPAPVNSVQQTFLTVAGQVGVSTDALHIWPHDLTGIDPFASAQIYFYYLPKTPPHAYPGVPAGLVSLEYWFYYPLNYFPLVRIPLEALSDPIGSIVGNTDYHQGDFEHVAVLLNPKTMQPKYLWMARHADEGQAYRWQSKSVQWNGDHATIYAAFGSHASYAHCGIQRRSRTFLFFNDYVVCIPHRTYGFLPSSTPLVDLGHTIWGCWRGHLGQAGRGLHRTHVGFAPYETDAPVSPLHQAENFGIACAVPPGTKKPAPQL